MKKRKFDGSLNEHWTWHGKSMKPKHKYCSREEALNAIVEQKLDSKRYNAYECSICGMWHIGHKH